MMTLLFIALSILAVIGAMVLVFFGIHWVVLGIVAATFFNAFAEGKSPKRR